MNPVTHRSGIALHYRILLSAASLALLAACASWHPVPDEAIRQGDARVYDHLLVVTRDGREIELSRAVIGADSVRGTASGTTTGIRAGDRVALAHDEVVRVESREVTAGATATAVGGFVLEFSADVFREIGKFFGCILSRGNIC